MTAYPIKPQGTGLDAEPHARSMFVMSLVNTHIQKAGQTTPPHCYQDDMKSEKAIAECQWNQAQGPSLLGPTYWRM